MKIYVDLLLFLNFAFDFLLLLSVSILLRRNVSINRVISGAFVGSLSILFLFIPISTITLFFLKIGISILMIGCAFGYRNMKYTIRNFTYLYITSIVLGGFLYFLNVQFSYQQKGLVFYHKGLSINYIVLIIFAPIILYLYVKQGLYLKQNYNHYYKVNLYLKNHKSIRLNAFLDTGNVLEDPYFHRPVILINKKSMIYDINEFGMILVPYKTVGGDGFLKCFPAEKIKIGKKEYHCKFLVGIMEMPIHLDGVDCILNKKIMEG